MNRGASAGLSPYDVYRDPEARKLMLDFVVSTRSIIAARAVAELRSLNHVGLVHVYRDALAAAGQGVRVDYDPCEAGRM